ncbi:ArdC family protein [Desulfobacterales bacterium HSG17]|nr:ArdC family protein [Desulfobacterales bacterium HSG17]
MNKKVKQVLNSIVEEFKSGNIPKAIAMACFPSPDTPSSHWSFTNRIIMFLSGTGDARGYRQWKDADRFVKKGSHPIHILAPYFKKELDEESGEEKKVLKTFNPIPVFKFEDTDGEELDYQSIEIPNLPLKDRAIEWGISLKMIPGNYNYYGYYSPKRKEIALATPEENVFFHELAHVGHEKIKGYLKTGQDPLQEIVAELSAQALCRLVGKKTKDTTGNSFRYIEKYAKKIKKSAHFACLNVMSETEKVLNLILQDKKTIS